VSCASISLCQRCIETLWFMQAALRDLSLARHDSKSFIICQRILHNCHEIIFGDIPPPASGPYSAMDLPFQSRFARKKIKSHAEPVFVGLGVILAGAPGMPQLTKIMGEVANEQGRIDDDGNTFKSLETQEDEVVRGLTREGQSSADVNRDEEDLDDDNLEGVASIPLPDHAVRLQDMTADNASVGRTPPISGEVPRHHTIIAAQTSPALPSHLTGIRRSRLSEDPLGQQDPIPSERVPTPYQSSPSLSSSKQPYRSSSLNPEESLLQKYDIQSQVHLLRSHYCRSEVCSIYFCRIL
jgi:phosphatidylinositol 4-kinase B